MHVLQFLSHYITTYIVIIYFSFYLISDRQVLLLAHAIVSPYAGMKNFKENMRDVY